MAICCLFGSVGFGVGMIGLYGLAEHHLRQARKALQRQRYDEALREYEAVLRLRPGNPDLHLLAGRTARQGGKFSVAWEQLHRCRELLGGVSAELQLEEYLLRAQTGELQEVFPYLLPYLSRDDAYTPLVLEALAHVYLYVFRFENAWQCLERWLALQPDNVEALFLRGDYFALMQDRERAVADLRRVLELDPKRSPARLLLGLTLQQMLLWDKAAAEYAIVLRQEPNNEKARLGLASCYVNLAQFAQAETVLQECSPDGAADAERADYLYLLGAVAEGQGRYADAVSYYQQTLAASPSDDVACYHLIRCYYKLGDEASATKYEALHERIKKDQKRFLAITKREKESLPSDPALCCELGELCMRLGMQKRGLHWLQVALHLNPRCRPAHEQLLRYYEQLGPEGEKQAQFHRRMLGQKE